MPVKKTSRKKKPRKARQRRKSRWVKIVRIAASVFLVLFVIGAFWGVQSVRELNRQVVSLFEGKRWELPARVYSRPLELFVGKKLSRLQLQTELELIGYRRVAGRPDAGEFSHTGNQLTVHLRGFPFTDGYQEPTAVELAFDRDELTGIESRNGSEIPLIRVEPALIANIYPRNNEDRILVRREDVPEFLINALLAVEDRDFYNHKGVKIRSIVRAMLVNLRAGRTVQGGSTLTQQLVKNFYLTSERTWRRKIKEAVMARILEYHYDKDEILGVYLNEIHLGQQGVRGVHGFGLAS